MYTDLFVTRRVDLSFTHWIKHDVSNVQWCGDNH